MHNQTYATDLNNRQWDCISPLVPPAQPGGRPRSLELRQVLNAMLYIVGTGCQWRLLPRDYPKWQSVYSYYARWRDDGTWQRMHDTLRAQLRRHAGRHKHPTAGPVQPRWQDDLARMEATTRAAQAGARFVIFSEAALTGFVNAGDPVHDLVLGHPVPGPVTTALARLARTFQIWLVVGLFERNATRLYDSALLFAADGWLRLHYRRIDPHWHYWVWRPGTALPYAVGTQLDLTSTPIGTCAILLCGDLFNDACQQRVKQLQPDWLIVPMARGFDSEVADTAEWYATARAPYLAATRAIRIKLLLVNQLAALKPDAHHFGGALVATADGSIVAEQPIEREGVLLVDL